MTNFFDKALEFSRTLYQPVMMGTLVVQLDSPGADAIPQGTTVLITEHRPLEARQHKLNLLSPYAVAQRLPTGEYSVTVLASGHTPHRTYTEIKEGQTSTIIAYLERTNEQPDLFAQKLKKYGVMYDSSSLPNLRVQAGTKVVLDPKSPEFGLDIHYTEMRTIYHVKSVLGHPDEYWPMEHPRFGRLAPTRPPAGGLESLTPAARAAMQEYVYGNSKSVVAWQSTLDNWLAVNPINVGIWVYGDVDVAANAVLEIGEDGLICDTLRVDPTGTVEVSLSGNRPIHIEMNTYEEYAQVIGGGGGGGAGGGRVGGGGRRQT
jgi:hypothetical protein